MDNENINLSENEPSHILNMAVDQEKIYSSAWSKLLVFIYTGSHDIEKEVIRLIASLTETQKESLIWLMHKEIVNNIKSDDESIQERINAIWQLLK